jgi:hypothetical protein
MRVLTNQEIVRVSGGIAGVSRETIGCSVGGAIGGRFGGVAGGLAGCAAGAFVANNMAVGGKNYGPFGGTPAGLRAWLIRLHTA